MRSIRRTQAGLPAEVLQQAGLPAEALAKAGFTLIEIVVAVVVVSVLTGILLVGYPSTRDHQDLLAAEQQLQTLVRAAQARALNEERDEACLALFDEDNVAGRRTCSDVGIHVSGKTITMFADIAPGPGDGEFNDRADYQITQQMLPGASQVRQDTTIVFRATPPTVNLYVGDGQATSARVTVEAGSASVPLSIYQYGLVSRSDTP